MPREYGPLVRPFGRLERKRKTTLAVVFGSRSVEHEVSVITAVQAMDAMDPRRYDVIPILLTKDGRWVTGPALRTLDAYSDMESLITRCSPVFLRPEPDGRRLYIEERGWLGRRRMRALNVDCIVPIVHGTYGEDGTLQGLLELTNIPYAGPGVVGAAVGMDKVIMKMVFQSHGLPTTRFIWFPRERWEQHCDSVLGAVEATLCYPLFVKPANLGSSVGISTATDREGLAAAIDIAAQYDRRLLVEEGVSNAREINCSVLGNEDDCQTSVCEEPIRWTDFLSYEDKYIRGSGGGMEGARRRIPADIPPALAVKIQEMAKEAFQAVDCAGVARVDFLLGPSGELFVNEINTTPGSLSFYLWQPSGIPYSALIDRLVQLAIKRRRDRDRTSYTFVSTLLSEMSTAGSKGKVSPFETPRPHNEHDMRS